jgi:LacI family transcriptional regulator
LEIIPHAPQHQKELFVTITIKDVAKRLDLSVTTVSRAIAGYSDVAESTRSLVLQTADEMGYVPRHAARNLRLQRTQTIGLILPTSGGRFTDPFFSEFLAGVGDEAAIGEYDLLVSVASPGDAEERTYRRWARSRRVDGFILFRMRNQDWRSQYLSGESIPFVSFGPNQLPNGQPWVGVDGRAGMLLLMEHLIEQGHRRIGFIGASEDLYFATNRLDGYRAGLAQNGLSEIRELITSADLTQSGGYQAAQHLLDLPQSPSAIIGINDLTALGAMRAGLERGLVIGRDLAIAGFDGTEAGEHAHPPLTTIAQPVYKIGRQVCQLLVRSLNGEALPDKKIILQPELVVRASSRFRLESM